MGHYASEMMGEDRILTVQEQAANKRYELKCERDKVLREARVVGMMAAVEHLIRNSPIAVNQSYIIRYLGLDGRGPEADSLNEAIFRMLTRKEDKLILGGNHDLSFRR